MENAKCSTDVVDYRISETLAGESEIARQTGEFTPKDDRMSGTAFSLSTLWLWSANCQERLLM